MMVNLVNTAGPHAVGQVSAFDEIPSVGPLEIVIRSGTNPNKVTLEPEGTALPYAFEQGEIRLTLRRLEIQEITVVYVA